MNFWFDRTRELNVTYKELLNILLAEGDNNIYIKEDNPMQVFISLLRNFLNQKESILLDADFSNNELLDLGISETDLASGSYKQQELTKKFDSLEEIIAFFDKFNEVLTISIYTSGTTGRPKKISQSYKNLTRAVKSDNSLKENIWGFAYNPTHFAGLQVFFQAFYNQNQIVYLFGQDYQEVYKSMLDRRVTHLSSTPTFMRILLSYVESPLEFVESLTFGGERFDSELLKRLETQFPNAVVKNVYASSEAGSLLRSEGPYFVIPSRYGEVLKIENDELLIHRDLLGSSSSFSLEGYWYKTGDLVRYVDDRRFLFIGRKSEMINVGGYKVNPTEVENVIKEVQGVKDVSVFGRQNSIMGQIIVAHVIKTETSDSKELKMRIKEATKSKLQEFKIPRLIKFVEAFKLTRTGKIKKDE